MWFHMTGRSKKGGAHELVRSLEVYDKKNSKTNVKDVWMRVPKMIKTRFSVQAKATIMSSLVTSSYIFYYKVTNVVMVACPCPCAFHAINVTFAFILHLVSIIFGSVIPKSLNLLI